MTTVNQADAIVAAFRAGVNSSWIHSYCTYSLASKCADIGSGTLTIGEKISYEIYEVKRVDRYLELIGYDIQISMFLEVDGE